MSQPTAAELAHLNQPTWFADISAVSRPADNRPIMPNSTITLFEMIEERRKKGIGFDRHYKNIALESE